MNTKLLGLTLLLIGSHCWAQMSELSNADVTQITSITNPDKAMQQAEGQWLAFSIPVIDGTRSPCCWKGDWNGAGEVGCKLSKAHHSYGTRSDSPVDENVIVFSEIRDGQVTDLRVVGESCPVDAGGAGVTWIGSVNEDKGLDWLEKAAQSNKDHSALHALALHRGKNAGKRLFALAEDRNSDLSEEAVFWLGESRGEQGYQLLKQLLDKLPKGETRRQINFALAQNDSEEAAELLFHISKSDSDPEQRGEAMFWLAQEYPQRAQPWLMEVLKTENNEEVLEQAVFAISQLPDGNGDQALLELAQDEEASREVRRQAIFWLANSDSDSSVAALTELLTQ